MAKSKQGVEAEVDYFCQRNQIKLEQDPAMLAWQEYKSVMSNIEHFEKMLVEDGEGSMSDLLGNMMTVMMTDGEKAAIRGKIAELKVRADELRPLAAEWARFVRDPEFGGNFAY